MALRTLIVEDDADAFESLSEYLVQVAGIELAGWATGEQQAVAFLERNRAAWDLAIVDLFLVEGSGLGVIAASRARRPQQKVAVLSNFSSAEMRRRCLELGADAVFDKMTEFGALAAFCTEASNEAAGR